MKHLEFLDEIAALSREYGADPMLVVAGGGNASYKEEDTLFVTASGCRLDSVDAHSFVALRRDAVRETLVKTYSKDEVLREQEVKGDLLTARIDPEEGKRPSVESSLHEALERRFVVHLHPHRVVGFLSYEKSERATRDVFGDDVIWMPYHDPGLTLSRAVAKALKSTRNEGGPLTLFLANHGIFIAADSVRDIQTTLDDILTKTDAFIESRGAGDVFAAGEATPAACDGGCLLALAPALRGALADGGGGPGPVVRQSACGTVSSLVNAADGRRIALAGPITPDQIVYAGKAVLWLDADRPCDRDQVAAELATAAKTFVETNGTTPKVAIVAGIGAWTIGRSREEAATVEATYADALKSIAIARSLGGCRSLSDREATFIDNWEVEAFRRKAAAAKRDAGKRARGKVAVVTGAAQGFGAEIAADLASEGAHVVLADVNSQGAEAAAREINEREGQGTALAVAMDVTDSASIAGALREVVREFGGVDLFLANAGVLRAGSVKTLDEADFDLVTSVNYRGYFLCVKLTAPIMAAQHKANGDYTSDIIQINSKSGLAGSNRNAAYAGGKFGGIGLTQSFALELVDDGIKVNAVCPGNFFEGPLWSDPENGLFVQYLRSGKVAGAKTVEDVRRAYEAKVPMGRGCTSADVMKAIYYSMEQQYETGQAIAVTGGQVMLH